MTIRGYSFPVPEKYSPAIIETLKKEKQDGHNSPRGCRFRSASLRFSGRRGPCTYSNGEDPEDEPGDRIQAKYRMGWDVLHALEVKKLDQ